MCFSTSQPAAPVRTPSYDPDDASEYFTVTMEDEAGNSKLLSERGEDQNNAATGYED